MWLIRRTSLLLRRLWVAVGWTTQPKPWSLETLQGAVSKAHSLILNTNIICIPPPQVNDPTSKTKSSPHWIKQRRCLWCYFLRTMIPRLPLKKSKKAEDRVWKCALHRQTILRFSRGCVFWVLMTALENMGGGNVYHMIRGAVHRVHVCSIDGVLCFVILSACCSLFGIIIPLSSRWKALWRVVLWLSIIKSKYIYNL